LGLTLFEWYAIADPDIDRAGDPDEWQQQAAHLYLELERLSGRASPTFWQRRSLSGRPGEQWGWTWPASQRGDANAKRSTTTPPPS